MHHTYVNELLAVYALGACERADIERIESHLSHCGRCDNEAQLLNEVAGWLGDSPATRPPASLRAKVLRQAQAC